jgi:PAS domain S-box-containing protein
MFGYRRGELREQVSSWEKIIHPADMNAVMLDLNNHLNGKASTYSSQHRVKAKSGSYIWIWDHGRVVEYDAAGKPLKAIGTHTDITEFKLAEQRFQISVEGGKLGMWEWNLKTEEVFLHNSWLTLHGLEPSNEGKRLVDFNFWANMVQPDDLQPTVDALNAYIKGETPSYLAEYRIKNPDGSWMWILDQGKVVEYDGAGKPMVLFGTHLDITTQKQHAQELQEMVTLRDKLMDILSHDLKSPVANIMGLTDIVEQTMSTDNMSTENMQLISMLSKSAKQLNDILTNMLLWSRVKGNRIEFEPEHYALGHLLEKSVEPLQTVADSKRIVIDFDLEDGGTDIYTDKNLFHIILNNILTNAIKFTPRKGKISIHLLKTDDSCVHLVIKDEGMGMEPEKAATLFVPGLNESTPGTEGEKGTGLGMLIVADFMRMHNGKVYVESKLNEGSTFHLEFPLQGRA